MSPMWRVLFIVFLVLYICVTVIAIFKLDYRREIDDVNNLKEHVSKDAQVNNKANIIKENHELNKQYTISEKANKNSTVYPKIEIWGKAAIGYYMWQHIMNGKLAVHEQGLVEYGETTIRDIPFVFRTGPGIIQLTVPSDVKFLVLVLNGRAPKNIPEAKLWLDYLPVYRYLNKLAVVLLGNERCDNDWILPYMQSHGGKINIVFLVYDSPLIDNIEFYQWPLGVAIYRGFPNILPEQVDLTSERSHMCNFLGTVRPNSSRETLMKIIDDSNFKFPCIIKVRPRWLPRETQETLNYYMHSIKKSDLTLSPVGKNSECYRIYEAMSLGSTPVVEDVVTPGNCDSSFKSPLRLLKNYDAPVIYIKNWNDLPSLLQEESLLTLEEKVERRIAVTKWYHNFKNRICDVFIQTLLKSFFGG